MRKKEGVIHVYLKKDGGHVVGDEEGLYNLWQAVAEATMSRKGSSVAQVHWSNGVGYPIHVLRVDRYSSFLKQFQPVRGELV